MMRNFQFIFAFYTFIELISGCPSNFQEIPNDNKCVVAVFDPEYYVDVIRMCARLQADVVKIQNIFENNFALRLITLELSNSETFIGVEKKPNGAWVYSDGSTLNYQNWMSGEPKNATDYTCALMLPISGQWKASECSIARPFLCSTSEDLTNCTNGGVFTDGFCFCPFGYEGVFCEKLLCWNGGTPKNGVCQCPSGFSGAHCETVSCTNKGPSPPTFTKHIDIVLVIEMSTTAFAQIVYLYKALPETMRDAVSEHRNLVKNFRLFGYNSTWAGQLAISPISDQTNVLSALKNFASNYNALDNSTDKCDTTVQLWQALAQAQQSSQLGSYLNVFLASKPDESQLGKITKTMSDLQQKQISVTVTNAGIFVCNNTQHDFSLLQSLCQTTNGEFYNLQQFYTDSFVRTIPMKFMQGLVAQHSSEDCTWGINVPFPVDAFAQSLLIAVNGYKPDVKLVDKYIRPRNMPILINDSDAGLSINVLRPDCDYGWEPAGDYCFKWTLIFRDYYNAAAYCHSVGAMLADDLTQDKHDFLITQGGDSSFWLGLNNLNATGWEWSREDGRPAMKYSPITTNFWPGGVAPNDLKSPCAYFDASKDKENWIAGNCSATKYVLCQKYRFDWNYEPVFEDSFDIDFAGQFYLQIQTQAPPKNSSSTTFTKGCSVKVFAQSHLQVYGGFSNDIHSDYPDKEPTTNSTQNRLIGFVDASNKTVVRSPVLTHGKIYGIDGQYLWDATTYQSRDSCSFNWISQPFTCPANGNDDNRFAVFNLGEDEYGFPFQRIVNAHCQ